MGRYVGGCIVWFAPSIENGTPKLQARCDAERLRCLLECCAAEKPQKLYLAANVNILSVLVFTHLAILTNNNSSPRRETVLRTWRHEKTPKPPPLTSSFAPIELRGQWSYGTTKKPTANHFVPRVVDRLPAPGRAIPDDGMPPAPFLRR